MSVDDLMSRAQELERMGIPPSEIQSYLEQLRQAKNTGVNPPDSTKKSTSLTSSPQISSTPPQLSPPDSSTTETPPEVQSIEKVKKLEAEPEEGTDSIPIYGHEIFKTYKPNAQPSQASVASDDYIIGAGDRFAITVYGQANFSAELPVQDDGSIFYEYMGKMYVAGLSYAKARKAITEKIRRFVARPSSIEVVLGQNPRTIRVNFAGMIPKPGTYEIPATTSVFNALFVVGGVQEFGSVRNIHIKRNGKTLQVFDLYKYLATGDANPIFLQDNDFIFVPEQQKIVEIKGGVKRPQRYELLKNEHLQDLIQFAGGLNHDAVRSLSQVQRTQNEKTELIDFPLAKFIDGGRIFQLLDGDLLKIRIQAKDIHNKVQVSGAVLYPDLYEIAEGERVSDLLTRAGGLQEDAFTERAYIVRIVDFTHLEYIAFHPTRALRSDNELLNPRLQLYDKILVFSKKDFIEKKQITVTGKVHKPGSFELAPNMTLKDLLYLVGGPTQDADLQNLTLMVRLNPENEDDVSLENQATEMGVEAGDKKPVMMRIAVKDSSGWQSDSSLDSVLVEGFDQLLVYSRYQFLYRKFVEVKGAINRPGSYQVNAGMSLKDILYMSGGLEENAEASYIDLYRRLDLRDRDITTTREPQKRSVVRINIDDNWQTSSIADTIDISRFEQVFVHSKRDFTDLGYVTIEGLVNKPGQYPLLPNMSLMDLFYMAGGIKLEADFGRIQLSRVIERELVSGELVPLEINITPIKSSQAWQADSSLDRIVLNSYDQVFVRKNSDFKLQENIYVEGEVNMPGVYNKMANKERVSSLVGRAGGATEIADLKGAYIYRDSVDGPISIRLDKALKRKESQHDMVLLKGDRLVIPPQTNVIAIQGNVIQPGAIVQFESGRSSFKRYVNLAGGFADRTKRNRSTVHYPDGRVKRAHSFLLIRNYPKVEQGCVINVAQKPKKEKSEKKERAEFSFQEAMAGITTMVTLLLLAKQLK